MYLLLISSAIWLAVFLPDVTSMFVQLMSYFLFPLLLLLGSFHIAVVVLVSFCLYSFYDILVYKSTRVLV